MTHPTDPVEAMREACAKAALVDRGPHGEPPARWHNAVARVGSVAAVRTAIKITREEIAAAIRALPLPAAPAHDAVREARERVVEAARELRASIHATPYVRAREFDAIQRVEDAVDAILAAERAASDGGKGGCK